MSELNTTSTSRSLHWQLLATVSAMALTSSASLAQATEADRPTVWIELGAQAERMSSTDDPYAPPFTVRSPRPFFETASPLSVERTPRYAVGGEGKITFAPEGSDWVFTAGIRYGRSNGKQHQHSQDNLPSVVTSPGLQHFILTLPATKFEDNKSSYREAHTVLDFAVGRDVGLGLFGDGVASLGVRYAQFGETSDVNFSSKPDHFVGWLSLGPGKYLPKAGFHFYTADSHAVRSFHGVGPSLSFTGDLPILRGASGNTLTFDWGMNGALLFGRQRANVSGNAHLKLYTFYALNRVPFSTYRHPNGHISTRSVIVPNIGGIAGISYRFPNAKLSAGYRADFFFNAMDGGLDAPHSKTVSFHGPFATVSIGLGG